MPSTLQYSSVRLQVERMAISCIPGAEFASRNCAGSKSGANATFSRTATGAVLWLIPSANNVMNYLIFFPLDV